jgi:hypothetical protein
MVHLDIRHMKLHIKQILPAEICHYASHDQIITSTWNRVSVKTASGELTFNLPSDGWKSLFGLTRLTRRALRLDKCNVVPVEGGYVCIRQGRVYRYDETSGQLNESLRLKNCRNVLHQSIAVIAGKELFFGEYGNNGERAEVPVYRSRDGGRSWQVVYLFPAGSIKHVHGCYYDDVEKKVWVLTGDFKDECRILCADRDFKNIEWIGDGQQTFRTCNVFFERDSVHWIMDSQLQDSYHIRLDRKTRKVERKGLFPGPVWYIKYLEDGFYLAATAQEIGPGVKDGFTHLMVSRDLETWQDVHRFSHDGLPKRWFKFGVIGFADGVQSSDNFYLFGEAIRSLDGRVALCAIEEGQS